ncbi:MAG: Uma2 family endonuclease [Candidatus Rokuibacteriota bacterium]
MAVSDRIERQPITGEELFRRPDLGPCELVEGRIVMMSPTGDLHGGVEANLATSLRLYVRRTKRGKVRSGEVGIYVQRNPDTIRAADVLYISTERWSRRSSSGYLDVAPELVAEILSPDDRWSDVTAKLADYFAVGVVVVWVVDPRQRKVFAYRSLTDIRQFEEGDLADEEILPGFALSFAELFEE